MNNLFPEVKRPYFIYTPSYTHKSSGVRTLHLLCHALNQIGEKAYIYPDNPTSGSYCINPALNTPVLEAQYQNFYQHNLDPIIIYPDIVKGNPLHAKNVIRYLLAPAGEYGGDSIFPDTDKIWGALPSISKNVFRIPVSDKNIFYPSTSSPSGSCFYSHKYEMHGNNILDITEKSIRLAGSLDNIANILRNSEVCYLYELSSIITEAALCGCPVELIRTEYFNQIDQSCMMGNVKWNDGETVKECPDYLTEYNNIISNFWENELPNFVKRTQEII